MRKRITLLVAAALTAAAMALGSAGAFADTQACEDARKSAQWDCKGNKLSNPGGKSFGKVS